jgi:hypothetical protein
VLLIVSSGNLSNVESDLEAAEQQVSSLSSQLAQAQTDKSQLQASLDEANDFLDAANAELASINAVFPPRNFSSSSELADWLQSNSISLEPPATTWEQWYSKALQRQADALADGFIISVDYDYFFDGAEELLAVWNIAVIDGTIWYWDPETDVPLQDNLLGPVG